jgi:hypothetical protein
MKNIAKNTLRYAGTVTLSQLVGDKKIKVAQVHNAGSYSLFNFFSDCLVGDFDIAKANRPTKIRLLSYVDEDANGNKLEKGYYESRSDYYYLYAKPEKSYNNGKSTVRYSFTIPRLDVEGLGSDCNRIALYTNSTGYTEIDNFAAICTLNLREQNYSAASALLIDWELNIMNRNEG